MFFNFKGYLLASDLDGTLLCTDRSISTENLDAIQAFKDRGGLFTIATGRSIASSRKFVKELPINAPLILFNGAMIYDFRTCEILSEHKLPKEAAALLSEVMGKFSQLSAEIYNSDRNFVINENSHMTEHLKIEFGDPTYATINELPDEYLKIMFVDSPENIDRVQEYIESKNINGFDFVRSTANYYEVLAKNVNKGSALIELCEIVGIDKQKSMAIGDYLNDYEMVEAAGISAVPENAHEHMKELADMVVRGNNYSAIADFIQKAFNI